MRGKRTSRRAPGWWPSRILLAIGIVCVAVTGLGLLASFGPPNSLSEPNAVALGPLLIPQSVAIPIAAFVAQLFGLIWMIRIFRGSRDEPPPWRYRSR